MHADSCCSQKPCQVVMSARDYDELRAHLFQHDRNEQHAFLVAGLCESERQLRWLVRDMLFASQSDLHVQTDMRLDLDPNYCLRAVETAASDGLHIIEAHSHPFHDGPGVTFSSMDRANEERVFPWYIEKYPWMRPVSLVFGASSIDGHWYYRCEAAVRDVTSVRVIGSAVRDYETTSYMRGRQTDAFRPEEVFDRQVLALGEFGQRVLGRLRVGIVGCGGLGSVVCEQLAYLGVREFVLVDPDIIEASNLNRLVFAEPADAAQGYFKVEVMARGIRRVRPDASVLTVTAPVTDARARLALRDVDAMVAGVDCDGARIVCNELAVRYLIPYLDLGTGIEVEQGLVTAAGGQIRSVFPGNACLFCLGGLDPHQVAVGTMNEVEQRRYLGRGYGTDLPQPAVLFLNTVPAALAVAELIKRFTGLTEPAGLLSYDALAATVTPISMPQPDPECAVCRRDALYARGDECLPTSLVRPIPCGDVTVTHERSRKR